MFHGNTSTLLTKMILKKKCFLSIFIEFFNFDNSAISAISIAQRPWVFLWKFLANLLHKNEVFWHLYRRPTHILSSWQFFPKKKHQRPDKVSIKKKYAPPDERNFLFPGGAKNIIDCLCTLANIPRKM